jgi:hypothetical protein
MSRISGFNTQRFVSQEVTAIAASGGQTGLYSGTGANAVFVRVVKHASQAGGSTPIAWLSYDPDETTPDATNSMPIYDGDSFWVWPDEIRGASAASSDANQPTAHAVLYFIS